MLKRLSPMALAIAGALALSTMPVNAATKHEFAKDSILVVYKKDASQKQKDYARRSIRGLMDDKNSDGIDDKFARLMDGRLAKLSLGKGMDVMAAIKRISKNSAVEYAEPNYIVKAIGMPDDPDFSQLWGMHNTGQNGGTADADIDAVEAWDVTTGDSSIVIGVIDTGTDYNHPDLQDNIWTNPGEIAGNGIDDDNNGVIDDVHGYSSVNGNGDPMDQAGHGTHVAGTIGAKGNDGVGVAGVNWNVTIIPCQFLDSNGSGSTAGAIACIDYLTNLKLNHGVDVKATNNSWGGGGYSQALKDSIEAAGDAGILFAAAAGNDAVDNDVNASYPSGYDSEVIISVASTTRNDEMSSFSQWGLTTVDIGAPGSNILSTTPDNSYSVYSGTSMATPHVAGAAALVWSINPDLTPVEMKEILMNTGDPIAALDGLVASGSRLNVNNALAEADPEPGYRLTVDSVNQTIAAGESASYAFSVGSVAGWTGDVDVSVSVSPALDGVSLSNMTVAAGGAFTVDVATTEDTLWGSYTITVDGVNGDMAKSKSVTLDILPAGLNDFDYSNNDAVDIPDDDDAGISSTIEIADELQIFGVNAHLDISHTWIGDLTVTLTSPTGTVAILHENEGGSDQDIVKSYSLSSFNGEIANGTWTLFVNDTVGADTGTLNGWGMTISGTGDAAPAAPVADFGYATDGLMVDFTNMSSDVNDDIASYSWSFGDGSASTEANPSYAYAQAGTYTVSLMVTDEAGNEASTSVAVEVFVHSVDAGIKNSRVSRRGTATVDLIWSGAVGDNVAIYRNGEMLKTTRNDGRQRDRIRGASGAYEYKICETETSLCSDPFSIQF